MQVGDDWICFNGKSIDAHCSFHKQYEMLHFYLSFNSIAEEEGHHAGVDLILEHPGGPGRGVHSQKGERVEGCEDAEDYNKL